jgi:rod shape-determining protein MreC
MRFFNKPFAIFSFLLALTLLLILLNVKGASKPVESTIVQAPRPFIYVLSGVGNTFKSFFTYFGSISRVNRQSAELKDSVRKLQQDNIVLQQYKIENEKLKKELNYRATAPFELISGTVIGKDPTGFSQAVILNIGSSDGVKEGAGVLAQGVLIGKVISVESFTSKVLLVTDPQSNIDAQISATGDNAIARGSYGSGVVVDMVSQNVQLNPGDQVVTAGLSSQIPKGILIGSVGQLQSQKNDLLQKATVVSGTDLKKLDFVSVIK